MPLRGTGPATEAGDILNAPPSKGAARSTACIGTEPPEQFSPGLRENRFHLINDNDREEPRRLNQLDAEIVDEQLVLRLLSPSRRLSLPRRRTRHAIPGAKQTETRFTQRDDVLRPRLHCGSAPILSGEFRSVMNNSAEEQHQDTNHADFTASEKINRELETVAGASMSSICVFFVNKADGVFGMDKFPTGSVGGK